MRSFWIWTKRKYPDPRNPHGGIFAAPVAVLLFATSPVPAIAADGSQIATNGNGHGAAACSICHGAQGEGRPLDGIPRLAGLAAGYIENQLEDFADGKRENATMRAIAKALAPDERTAVATYYAVLHAPAAAEPKPLDAKIIVDGAQLADHPTWSKGLPACSQCHGAGGIGVGSNFPRLAGQSSTYIQSQLKAWQQGQRRNDPLSLMIGISTKLTGKDIAAVAAYYASLSEGADAGATKEVSP